MTRWLDDAAWWRAARSGQRYRGWRSSSTVGSPLRQGAPAAVLRAWPPGRRKSMSFLPPARWRMTSCGADPSSFQIELPGVHPRHSQPLPSGSQCRPRPRAASSLARRPKTRVRWRGSSPAALPLLLFRHEADTGHDCHGGGAGPPRGGPHEAAEVVSSPADEADYSGGL